MFKQLKNLGTEKTIPDNTDIIPIQQSDGITRHITRQNFLTGIGGGTQAKYIQLVDSRAIGTQGGTAAVNTWTKRTINTIVVDETGQVSISNNLFTLPEGNYFLDACAYFYKGNFNRLRLFNQTDNQTVFYGLNGYGGASDFASIGFLKGKFLVQANKQLGIEYRVTSNNGGVYGLGDAQGATNEIYLIADIWKI